MTNLNDLDFQYPLREPELLRLPIDAQAMARDTRDKGLEDYLGALVERVKILEAQAFTEPADWQAGSATQTTGATGLVSLTFPTAFASTPRFVIAFPREITAAQHTAQITTSVSATGAQFRFFQAGAALVSTSITYRWLAVL